LSFVVVSATNDKTRFLCVPCDLAVKMFIRPNRSPGATRSDAGCGRFNIPPYYFNFFLTYPSVALLSPTIPQTRNRASNGPFQYPIPDTWYPWETSQVPPTRLLTGDFPACRERKPSMQIRRSQFSQPYIQNNLNRGT